MRGVGRVVAAAWPSFFFSLLACLFARAAASADAANLTTMVQTAAKAAGASNGGALSDDLKKRLEGLVNHKPVMMSMRAERCACGRRDARARARKDCLVHEGHAGRTQVRIQLKGRRAAEEAQRRGGPTGARCEPRRRAAPLTRRAARSLALSTSSPTTKRACR